jgi:hypothetical protein
LTTIGSELGAVEKLLAHENRATRCAAYRACWLKPVDIAEAIGRDGRLAYGHLEWNKRIWCRSNTREALKEAIKAHDAVHNGLYSELSPSMWQREDEWRKQHPEWFNDEVPAGEVEAFATRTDIVTISTGIQKQLADIGHGQVALLCVLVAIVVGILILIFR